jgi:hypothetical protein
VGGNDASAAAVPSSTGPAASRIHEYVSTTYEQSSPSAARI